MNEISRVAAPPAKPLMVYDGDCRFCTLWIKRWQQTTGERVEYLPFQDPSIAERFPEISRGQFEAAVQLIETDGRVYAGAEAALRALAKSPTKQWLLHCYERSPLLARIAEGSYRFVASHRTFFSALTRLAYGKHVERPSHFLVRRVFLRAMGIIYLVAFVSLWTQIVGLVGSNGILPEDQWMKAVRQQVEQQHVGVERYHLLPTLCWWNTSDSFLHFQCAAGTILALLVIVGIAPAPCLFLLWLIYLSLSVTCREFLGFQWDNLLLETGFLAIFFAPMRLWPSFAREAPPSRITLWLLRWLLFRLMFESGCVKLLSGDPTWRNLTALTVHYETQPLPTWIGWYAHQLPLAAHKMSCVLMFGIELIVPFFIFMPRRPRFFAAWAMIALQVGILVTGNYCFFNLLTIALCLLLFDDFALQKLLPSGWRARIAERITRRERPLNWLRLFATVPVAIVILLVSTSQLYAIFHERRSMPMLGLQQRLAPFRTINSYGLFAVMTTTRPEIIVEGSNDGQTWLPYEFKYKPGDPKRRPRFVAPHQPRLDWQMWFAALGTYERNPWLVSFCVRLLQGSPEVLALLETNPFPDAPPRYIRARVYDYRFTDIATRRQTGNWWRREFKEDYLPVLSRREER